MIVDSSCGYELRLRQKYSLCWFQTTGSKFQRLRAEVRLLRVQNSEVTIITGYGSTQNDEHLCEKWENRACGYAVTSARRELNYGTCLSIYT